jgi:hypothetical protein
MGIEYKVNGKKFIGILVHGVYWVHRVRKVYKGETSLSTLALI